MPATTTGLTTAELRSSLRTYEDTKTTDQLYGLGSMLMAECMDRAKHLDTRAIALGGYSGVTAGLLVAVFSPRLGAMPWLSSALILGAGVCLFATTCFAFSALWIREHEWFSDEDWF